MSLSKDSPSPPLPPPAYPLPSYPPPNHKPTYPDSESANSPMTAADREFFKPLRRRDRARWRLLCTTTHGFLFWLATFQTLYSITCIFLIKDNPPTSSSDSGSKNAVLHRFLDAVPWSFIGTFYGLFCFLLHLTPGPDGRENTKTASEMVMPVFVCWLLVFGAPWVYAAGWLM